LPEGDGTLLPKTAAESNSEASWDEAFGRRITYDDDDLVGQFQKRVEPHFLMGLGPLAFVAKEQFPLLAVQPLEEPLRSAKESHPLTWDLATRVRLRRFTHPIELFGLQTAQQFVPQ
jgi:hypothetical protein